MQSTSREQEDYLGSLAAAEPRKGAQVAKRERKASEHPAHLFNAFAEVARATWPEMEVCRMPTQKQVWQLRAIARKWEHPSASFKDFLEWSAQSWRTVHAAIFAHVKTDDPRFQVSRHPDIGTLIYFHKAFTDAFVARNTLKVRAGLTREDELMRRLMFKGMSHEDATKAAMEIMARDKKREDLDARELEIERASRRITAKEQDIDNRIAIGRSHQTSVKPVSLTQRLEPSFLYSGDEIAPLPPFPVWKDEPEEGSELVAA